MTIESKIVDITPQKATHFLQNNNHNRPISDKTVWKYSKDMSENKWVLNGSPIIISDEGHVIDGQHRLSAIVKSGVTVPMLLVEGVRPSAFKTVDIGKKRTGADALATHNKDLRKSSSIVAAAVSTIFQFDKEGVFDSAKRSNPPSHGELIDFVAKNKGILRSADFCSTLTGAKKLVPLSCLTALHFLLGKVDINTCESFFHKLNTGENLRKNDPVLVLRNRLIEVRHAGGVFRTREVMPYLLKTWEYIREGREVERLRIDNTYTPKII